MPANSTTTPTAAETLQRSAGRLRDAEQLVAVTEGRELDYETADCLASLLSLVRRNLDRLAASIAPPHRRDAHLDADSHPAGRSGEPCLSSPRREADRSRAVTTRAGTS